MDGEELRAVVASKTYEKWRILREAPITVEFLGILAGW